MYLDRAIALSKREIDRTQSQPEINHLARIYHSRFLECREIYVDRLQCDLVGAFKRFQDGGFLEIITCAATHGFLPVDGATSRSGPRPDSDRSRRLSQ